MSLEIDGIHYQSLRNREAGRHRYEYLQLILNGFAEINPRSIQKTLNEVLKKAGFRPNYSTENYAYTLVSAFRQRVDHGTFLAAGELVADIHEPERTAFLEGSRVAILVDRVERNPKARRACIDHFGIACQVCGFNFEDVYGEFGKSYIHVHHHRELLSASEGEHEVDPIRDLIPLCPNCHAMVHLKQPMLSIKDLKRLFSKLAGQAS